MADVSGRADIAESQTSSMRPMMWGAVLYGLLLAGFWAAARHSALLASLGSKLPWAFASFVLVLAPLWFFGFGAAEWIRKGIRSPSIVVSVSAFLAVPYFVFSIPTGHFHWEFGLSMVGLPVVLAVLVAFGNSRNKLAWQDVVVLAVIAATHMLKLLARAWPYPGLGSFSKLYLIDLALYLYVVVRKREGMGYSLVPTGASFVIGVREFCYFLPFGLGLGAALRFIHFHARVPSALTLIGAIVLTFLLVAIPEEIFFRGILQNLLETRLGQRGALLLASLFFGLGHFNKGAAFNWRYVLLAAIAGVFYGRSWQARRRILASAITHAAVDVVWSLWFR